MIAVWPLIVSLVSLDLPALWRCPAALELSVQHEGFSAASCVVVHFIAESSLPFCCFSEQVDNNYSKSQATSLICQRNESSQLSTDALKTYNACCLE